jgi:hypothetical protein
MYVLLLLSMTCLIDGGYVLTPIEFLLQLLYVIETFASLRQE